jgi:hypothetical protein
MRFWQASVRSNCLSVLVSPRSVSGRCRINAIIPQRKEYMVTPHTVDIQEALNEGTEYFEESSRDAYEKWLKSATDKEREIADRALGFEFNFFYDLLLSEPSAERDLDDIPEFVEEISQWMSVSYKCRFIVDHGFSSEGAGAAYDLATRTFRIHPDLVDNDLVLIHELIHHYDYGLQKMLWRDFVVIRLYEKLRATIPNLWQHCRSHFSQIVPRCGFMVHTLLFLLISLYFDHKLGLPLGSIFDYDKHQGLGDEANNQENR